MVGGRQHHHRLIYEFPITVSRLVRSGRFGRRASRSTWLGSAAGAAPAWFACAKPICAVPNKIRMINPRATAFFACSFTLVFFRIVTVRLLTGITLLREICSFGFERMWRPPLIALIPIREILKSGSDQPIKTERTYQPISQSRLLSSPLVERDAWQDHLRFPMFAKICEI